MSSTIESSSISFLTTPSLFHNTFNHPINIKLDRSNYLLRKSQIIPAIQGHNLGGFLFGTLPCPPKYQEESTRSINPDYIAWEQQDQLLLCWLLASIFESKLSCSLDHPWNFIGLSDIIQYHATSISTPKYKKGSFWHDDYLLKMKNIADKLATAREPVDSELNTTLLWHRSLPDQHWFLYLNYLPRSQAFTSIWRNKMQQSHRMLINLLPT